MSGGFGAQEKEADDLRRFNETEQSKSAWSFGLGLLGFGSSE